MRKILMVMMLAAAFATAGCVSYVTPVANIAEIDDVDMTTSFKTGESCAWLLLQFIGPFGDMSVVKASQGAGIRKVEVVDYRMENYLIVQRQCAYVYGQ